MGLNTIPISTRTLPYESATTANGSYTLPRFAFIPHPSLQQLAGPMVGEPTPPDVSAAFAAPPQLQRPYPVPNQPAVYGVRAFQIKQSP